MAIEIYWNMEMYHDDDYIKPYIKRKDKDRSRYYAWYYQNYTKKGLKIGKDGKVHRHVIGDEEYLNGKLIAENGFYVDNTKINSIEGATYKKLTKKYQKAIRENFKNENPTLYKIQNVKDKYVNKGKRLLKKIFG